MLDDIGRPSISRDAARDLLTERREQEAAAARHREAVEQRAIEADRRFRAALPGGVSAATVPPGVSAAELLMLSDPFPSKRRQSVLEHSLEHPSGSIVFTPINDEAS